jgi:hypothetical protein
MFCQVTCGAVRDLFNGDLHDPLDHVLDWDFDNLLDNALPAMREGRGVSD